LTDPNVSSLVNSVTFLHAVVLGGLALSATVVLLRFTRNETFTVLNVTLNLRYAWVVFAFCTIAHLYAARLVTDDVRAVAGESVEVQRDAWNQITRGGFLLLHGMHSRTVWVDYRILFIPMHKLQIETDDRTKVLHYASAILLLIACTNWHWLGTRNRRIGFEPPQGRVQVIEKCTDSARCLLSWLRQILPSFLLSTFIVLVNWITATRWVYAISQLTPPD
jgi:hypothetical protein